MFFKELGMEFYCNKHLLLKKFVSIIVGPRKWTKTLDVAVRENYVVAERLSHLFLFSYIFFLNYPILNFILKSHMFSVSEI